MAKQKATKRRTKVKDLPKKKKELSKSEQKKIQGGSAPPIDIQKPGHLA